MMNTFSNDVDILRYEPAVFGDLYLPSQVLTSGISGVVSGTTFTKTGEDFNAASVSAGCVIHMQSNDGSVDGAYEIVSVDSATQLTVSVLRTESADTAVGPPAASNISYRICTYQPQANEVFFQLTQHFGLQPGVADSDYDADDILDAVVLRPASICGTIAIVYAMLASRADGNEENFWKKNRHYQKLFGEARQRCRVNIDAGDDGVSDMTNAGTSIRLLRD